MEYSNDIKFISFNGYPEVRSDSGYNINFFQRKQNNNLHTNEEFISFIKRCEKTIRAHPDYTAYISHIINDIGLNHCFVFPNITTDMDVTIEMHHGPIFTLFDYCTVVTDWMLNNGLELTSFRVADIVLQEHFDENIQIIMLCKTAHQTYHSKDAELFLNLKQAHGNLGRFIEKYKDGLNIDQIKIMKTYIELCETFESNDFGMFNLVDKIQSYNT